MTERIMTQVGTATILLLLLVGSAAAQVPEPGRPVCVVAFCSPASKHPNMQIPCSSDGCECDDTCGGSGSQRSGGSQGSGALGQLLTTAVVAAAKVLFVVAAPGHAVEAFSKKANSAAAAEQDFRDSLAKQAALAQHGRDLGVEWEALRQFARAVRERESNPHRYLRPLFEPTDRAPRMNVRDSLQQLRCIGETMKSAASAVESGVPGDISFLDARRAIDIASGSWDSGLAPAGCGGEPMSPPALGLTAAERQQLFEQTLLQLQNIQKIQAERTAAQAQLDAAKKRAEEDRKRLDEEQNTRLAAAEQTVRAAQHEAEDRKNAVEEVRKPEPPPGPAPKLPDKPDSELLRRLLRAKAQADAQVEQTTQALEQTRKDIAAETQKQAADAATLLKPQQDSLSQASAALGTSLEILNKEFESLGLATPIKSGPAP